MKKQTKIQLVTFILFAVISAVSVLLLKFSENRTLAFAFYYTVQSAFMLILSAYDGLWGFCAYSSVMIVLNFTLPFNSYAAIILSAVSNIAAILTLKLLFNKLRAGTLIAFSGAALLRYVIAHYGLLLFKEDVHYEQIKDLFGIPALVSTLVLIVLVIFAFPAVKLAVKGVSSSEPKQAVDCSESSEQNTND